jgi:hypothetical protein
LLTRASRVQIAASPSRESVHAGVDTSEGTHGGDAAEADGVLVGDEGVGSVGELQAGGPAVVDDVVNLCNGIGRVQGEQGVSAMVETTEVARCWRTAVAASPSSGAPAHLLGDLVAVQGGQVGEGLVLPASEGIRGEARGEGTVSGILIQNGMASPRPDAGPIELTCASSGPQCRGLVALCHSLVVHGLPDLEAAVHGGGNLGGLGRCDLHGGGLHGEGHCKSFGRLRGVC